MFFHDEEKVTIIPLFTYIEHNNSHILTLTYSDEESYDVVFFAECESGDFDEESYDEYREIIFTIVTIHKDGTRRYNDTVTVHYKKFPSRITDTATGNIIYDQNRELQWLTDAE